MRARRSVREILITVAPLALAVFVFAVSFGVLAMAAGAGEPGRPDRRTLLVTGASLYSVWVLGTLLGTLLGPVLGNPTRLGLDAAFPALFTALLWPMLSAKHAVRCAIGGAVVALALAPFTPPGLPLAGAALVGLWLAR